MSERNFADAITKELIARRFRVLRICDYTEGRAGVFGLRVVGEKIKSSGTDYLVLPEIGAPVVLARDIETVRREMRMDVPFFLELKDPERRVSNKSKSDIEQERWMRFVGGGR